MPPARLVHGFDDDGAPDLAEIGGKGLSLVRLRSAGFTVPPGFVLTTAFFERWLEVLTHGPAWAEVLSALERGDEAALARNCEAAKEQALALALGAEERRALATAADGFPNDALLAVRSSSPEEDLEGSSFAGGYETVLGVTRERLEDAILRAFTSCLDARVLIYKRAHGFDPRRPRIAVVVQRQIASEVAGVAFSLDPMTNDYDVVVVNANWGLGETVVGGTATPDLFLVDKVERKPIVRRLGAKETSVWLCPDGGTEERDDPRHDTATLGDHELGELTDQVVRIEELYGRPVDVEWAFAAGALHLLQARPVTAYHDLPDDLRTARGAPRRLWWDATISVQGLLEPLSAMATSVLGAVVAEISRRVLGREGAAPGVARHGRLLIDVSRLLGLRAKGDLARIVAAVDPVVAAALEAVDEAAYRSPARLRPSWRLLPRLVGALWRIGSAMLWPDAARLRIDREVADHLAWLRRFAATASLEQLVGEALRRTATLLFERILPRFAASKLAMRRIRRRFREEALVARLDQALPGNVTVEMGLDLVVLARKLPAGIGLDELEGKLASGDLPGDFVEGWHAFLARHGHRGPRELDVAAPRYREAPRVLFGHLVELARSDDAGAARARDQRRSEREEAAGALADLARRQGRVAAWRFQRERTAVEKLGGLRETPKYVLVALLDVVRARLLAEAERLMSDGRLDRAEQIFDLDLADVARAADEPGLDLRRRGRERRAGADRLARTRELPRLFDSRGRILRPPPRPARPGELAGHPVSAGVARGPVKVLHTPDEKPLAPGDVLVARATDPGWTPLFVHVGAVVLEVGGVMQHGALVAREYGKPCVVGVERATERLSDGMLVEVDGAAGTVRIC